MKTVMILTLLSVMTNSVVIDPTTNDPYATVTLTSDPRNINKATGNGKWEIFQSWDNPLDDWALTLNLDAEIYSFQPDIDGSTISISIDAKCAGKGECDAYFAFGIDSKQCIEQSTLPQGTFNASNFELVSLGDNPDILIADTTASHLNLVFNCTNPDGCQYECTETASCYESTLYCGSSVGCNVKCDGNLACSKMNIFANKTPSTSIKIMCHQRSCIDMVIYIEDITNIEIYCTESEACTGLKINVDGGISESGKLDCYGNDSCDDVNITCNGNTNEKYFTFVTDLDGEYVIDGDIKGERTGIFVYPECGSNVVITGDPSSLIPTDELNDEILSEALSGGDVDNFGQLSSKSNGENFPLTFELINNDLSDTFTFRFSSPKFTGNDTIECTYNSAVAIKGDVRLYFTPDGDDETIKITSFEVNGVSTGYTQESTTDQPTTAIPTTSTPTTAVPTTVSSTLDVCEIDIEDYLEQCYRGNNNGNRKGGYSRSDAYGYDYDGGSILNATKFTDFAIYLILVLNVIILGYNVGYNSGCCYKGDRVRYEKGYTYSDDEKL